jgi:hypothetical protein
MSQSYALLMREQKVLGSWISVQPFSCAYVCSLGDNMPKAEDAWHDKMRCKLLCAIPKVKIDLGFL